MRITPLSDVTNQNHLRTIVNQVVRQVSDNTGSISLVTDTTILRSSKIVPSSTITLTPRTIEAANAKYWISQISTGAAEIRTTDTGGNRVYDYVIHGSI
nr:hypothetical protein RP007_00732 [Rhizobium sp. P007]